MVKPRKFILPQCQDKEQREIAENLLEWGIDEFNGDRDHRDFGALYRSLIRKAQAGLVDEMLHDPQMLPADALEAVRIVLRSTIQESTRHRVLDDSISGESWAPYNVYPSRFADEKDVVFVKQRWEFDRLSRLDLDPLNRFTMEQTTKREYFFSWAMAPEDNSIKGLVFEALLASHAIHNVACFHCYGRKCFRWNGGHKVSWADLVCIHCDSTYEIKSKHDMESIERSNEYKLRGGDFKNYCSLRQERRKDGWKRYIVEVSRKTSSACRTGSRDHQKWFWNVQIAEISKLIPALTPACFVDKKKMRPKSVVVTKKPTEFWFRLPYVKINQKKIVQEILEEQFPGIMGEIDATSVAETGAKPKEDMPPPESLKQEVDLDALRRSLHNEDEVSDWEDLLDDE